MSDEAALEMGPRNEKKKKTKKRITKSQASATALRTNIAGVWVGELHGRRSKAARPCSHQDCGVMLRALEQCLEGGSWRQTANFRDGKCEN